MGKADFIREFEGYTFRTGRLDEAEAYFEAGFEAPDRDSLRLTGSRRFSRDEVIPFFLSCIDRDDRADFLLISPDGKILGESVLNEFDEGANACNYRICIFSPAHRDRGLGTWMTRCALEYAFDVWGLDKVTLEVFSGNPRAEAVYRKCGFRRDEILPGEAPDGLGDIVCMSVARKESGSWIS